MYRRKYLTIFTILFLIILFCLFFISPNFYVLQAKEKESIKDRTKDFPDLGFTIIKPKGKEWTFSSPIWGTFCVLNRWESDKPEEQKGLPWLTITVKADRGASWTVFDAGGGKQVIATDVEGICKAYFDTFISQFDDPKVIKEPHRLRVRFSRKAWSWSFYAKVRGEGYAVYLREVYFLANDTLFTMRFQSLPGDETKAKKGVDYIFRHIKTYRPKKK